MNYWNHVLWTDESKVNLFDSDGVQHVWRRPVEEYQENCALPTVKHGGGSIMVLRYIWVTLRTYEMVFKTVPEQPSTVSLI